MAQQLTCDMCNDEPAVFMQSSLVNGDTIAIGDACLPQFCLTVLTALIDAMDPDILAVWAPTLKPAVAELTRQLSGVTAEAPEAPQDASPASGQHDYETGKEKDNGQEAKPRPARRRSPAT